MFEFDVVACALLNLLLQFSHGINVDFGAHARVQLVLGVVKYTMVSTFAHIAIGCKPDCDLNGTEYRREVGGRGGYCDDKLGRRVLPASHPIPGGLILANKRGASTASAHDL